MKYTKGDNQFWDIALAAFDPFKVKMHSTLKIVWLLFKYCARRERAYSAY